MVRRRENREGREGRGTGKGGQGGEGRMALVLGEGRGTVEEGRRDGREKEEEERHRLTFYFSAYGGDFFGGCDTGRYAVCSMRTVNDCSVGSKFFGKNCAPCPTCDDLHTQCYDGVGGNGTCMSNFFFSPCFSSIFI
jgi:hypothetical protein